MCIRDRYISLAGGALSSTTADVWKNFLASSQERPKLIDKIVQFTKENNLDGVDVDLEWSHITAGYSDFVIELKQKLSANSLGMTAAFPSETKYSCERECLFSICSLGWAGMVQRSKK